MKNYVYLAGSITKHIEKDTLSRAIYWRKVASKMLRECGIKYYDPTLNFIRNKDNTDMKRYKTYIMEEALINLPKTYIDGIANIIDDCDTIIENMKTQIMSNRTILNDDEKNSNEYKNAKEQMKTRFGLMI